MSIEGLLFAGALLLLLSIAASKTSQKLGVPALLLFLMIGMLAGSDGPGGIHFTNAWVSQFVGTIALVLILFAGGLSTDLKDIRSVFWDGISLATIGVLVTAASVGWFAHQFFGLSLKEGLLLGALVSSTDATAVFTVMGSRHVSLKSPLKPLLEFESGSNDPMAVFLTVAVIQLILHPGNTVSSVVFLFFQQMGIGAVLGMLSGYGMSWILKRLDLEFEGLYPVLSVAMVVFVYGATTLIHGSGFLAVYIAGVVLANRDFLHKKTLLRFHDGIAWLMQIGMFLTLGLLVFPTKLLPIAPAGLCLAIFLILIARPLSVWSSLLFSKIGWREQVMTSWVGLRGAAPIILATFPLVAGVPKADYLFHLVFFIVLASIMVQGPFIPFIAKLLKVTAPAGPKRRYPLEFEQCDDVDANLEEFIVPYNSVVVGRPLVHLGLPEDCLIALISRDGKYIVPNGTTRLEESDVLLVLVTHDTKPTVARLLTSVKKPG